MDDALLERLASAAGDSAVRREPSGRLRATPPSVDALAHFMGVAYDARLTVEIEGSGTWQPSDAPTAVVVSTRALDEITAHPRGGATLQVQAGAAIDAIRREALERGMWLPIDAPGRPDRSIGSVVATATSGPLRHGFGPIRGQVTAITVVTGDGRVVRIDGDPDRISLHAGSFGAFGIVADLSLQLHDLPRADATWVTSGDRDRLTAIARDLASANVPVAAIELFSPALAAEARWTLAVRLMGSHDEISVNGRQVAASAMDTWQELDTDRQSFIWSATARAVSSVPVTIRLGVLAAGIDETIDLVVSRLGEGLLSAGVESGVIRWSGDASAQRLVGLRTEVAAREIPMTVERAPWALRRRTGHYGTYREGASRVSPEVRAAFDPAGIFIAPLSGLPDE